MVTHGGESPDRELLLALVETFIPAGSRGTSMPAAAELAEFREISGQDMQRFYGPLLERVRSLGSNPDARDFARLDPSDREAILREIEADEPGLLRGPVLQTMIRYYESSDVALRLGLEARPPHPQGYNLGETDWGLLDPVRAMQPIYKADPAKGDG